METVIVTKWAVFLDPDSEHNISTEEIVVKDSTVVDTKRNGCTHLIGISFAILASFLFSMSTLIVKILAYEPFNLAVWRSCVIIAISVFQLAYTMVWEKQSLFDDICPVRNKRVMLILSLQTLCAVNAMLVGFYGLQYVNFADFIVIATSTPVFVTFISFLLLREQCGIFPVFTAFLALVGVTIISKPPILTGAESIDQDTLIGVGATFVCMILVAFHYVLMRYLTNVHHALINLSFGAWGLLQSLVFAVVMDVLETPKDFQQVGYIILSAAFACFARSFVTLALKYEEAGPVSLARTIEVVFAFAIQTVVLQVNPDIFSIIGAILTLSGVILTACRKIVSSRPAGDKYRRWCCCLLL